MNLERFVLKTFVAAVLLSAFSHAVRGEELAVYTTTASIHDVTHAVGDITLHQGGREVNITVYKPGKRVGTLETGSKSIASIYDADLGFTLGRFLGGGPTYLLKSKSGAFYVIFMEYRFYIADQKFRGSVYEIGKVDDLGSGGAVFVGTPYESGGVDPTILKQLGAITERVKADIAAHLR